MASILVIEDNIEFATVMVRALASAGHEVASSPNGTAAFLQMKAQAFNLVITDLIMPERDGFEVLLQLRHIHPRIPVIAISGDIPRNAEHNLQISGKLGAARTLLKPFTMATLLDAVAGVLRDSERPQDSDG